MTSPEEKERARLATARAYSQSTEGRAMIARLFDPVRGRALAAAPEDEHERKQRELAEAHNRGREISAAARVLGEVT